MEQSEKKYSGNKGSRYSGKKEFKAHYAAKDGEIMSVAEKNVITVTPTSSIKNVATLMRENDVRRIPVVDPGTNRLEAWRGRLTS
ncbi:MAG: CBS domain-containing protein [Candidatus Altiarchaeota archaeon]|nr:CBS domain-containing protein [Candidatus Altiarchaeota archaeon]